MANQIIVEALFQEGTSHVRPPYFNGQHFSNWKVCMEIYAKAYDVKVWRVIKKGNYPLPAAAQPLADPKDIDSYTNEQMAVVQVNNKARNLLYNAISGEEYEKISSYDTTKEMWDKFEVTYEGTSKVKETHINMLVHDYELFQLKEGESIEEMFARFSKIFSDLKAFGKPYSCGDQVRKILKSLPTTWQTKVVTLESQDLNKLSYDELQGELIAFEKTHLKKTNQKEKNKIVAFKATTEIAENDIDDDPEALQEEIPMLSRNMDSLMRRFGNTRRGRIPPRRSRQYNKKNKNDGKCYECGRFGYIQVECPDLKSKIFRGFNKNKSFGSWNDEDSSEHEEIENLCFMTILENEMNKSSGCWTDEDTSDDECKDNNENCFMARGKTSEEHHRRSRKGKWYLGSACSSHLTGDKNLFKKVTKIDGGSVKFGDDSKGKIIGYEVNFKKTGCAIEAETEFVYVIFNENNPLAEKGITAGDEDQAQEIQETSKSQKSADKSDATIESTNEMSNRDSNEGMKTRGALKKKANMALISQVESKKIEESLKGSIWIQAMQEELDQFGKNQVWKLIPKPENVSEGVEYDKIFAPVARLKSIQILLSYASFKGFRLFQMEVKSAFLNGFIEEEVYVKQPPGFIDSNFPTMYIS
uniref:Uncharacterized protein LOC104239442 n=1 Tax=Nicotiana sylvestris TaxID=4096 RepID=A0A1U7XRV8_NICSY|nr:PREDICTED: uncharacterized protein LOC104239442 [Nicotiana sylvestris]